MFERLKAILGESSALSTSEMVARLLLAFLFTVAIAAIYSRNYKGYGRPSQMAPLVAPISPRNK